MHILPLDFNLKKMSDKKNYTNRKPVEKEPVEKSNLLHTSVHLMLGAG